MTESHPDARSVMLHTLLGIEEVQQKLANVEGLKPKDAVSIKESIDILKNIWEVTNDHKQTLATIVRPANRS